MPTHTSGSEPSPGDIRMAHDRMRELYGLFGLETIMVPIIDGEPAKGWQGLKLDDTLDPDYQQALRVSGLAVVTGNTGHALRVIQCRSDQYRTLKEKLPWVRDTLTMMFNGIESVFFRMDGPEWPLTQFECGVLVTDPQAIPLPGGNEQETGGLRLRKQVQTLTFEEVLCTSMLKVRCLPALLGQRFGPATRMIGGKRRLGRTFWAEYFRRVNEVQFVEGDGFRVATPEGPRPVSVDLLHSSLAEFISLMAQSPGYEYLADLINPAAIRGILRVVESFTRVDREPVKDRLPEFIQRELMTVPGRDVRTSELYSAYKTYSLKHGHDLLSKIQFSRKIKAALGERGFPSSGSIVRGAKQGRGFRNLTFRASGTDGTFGTLGAPVPPQLVTTNEQ
jgi:hypothetical protein